MTASSQDNFKSSSSTDSLKVARQEYQYNYTHIPPLAMVDELPPGENFSTGWIRLLVKELRVIFVNTLITNRGNHGSKSIRDDVKRFILEALIKGMIPARLFVIARLMQIVPQLLLKGMSKDLREIDDLLFSLIKESGLLIFKDALDRVKALLAKDRPTGHVTSLKDYEKLYPVIEPPAIANTFLEDEFFAYMRVAGYNPLVIERVTKLGDRFPVQDSHYQAVMGSDDSLTAAGEEGRLYLADYKIFEGGLNGTYLKHQKYLYAPLALFAVPKGSDPSRLLRPVAIQCGQTPGDDNPIVTPKSDKYAWLFAKTVIQIADANYHEPISHLGRTHLFG